MTARDVGRLLYVVTALAYAAIVIMAFGVIIAREGTIDGLRDRIDAGSDATACRNLYVNDVLISGAALDSQLADLFAVVVALPEDDPANPDVIVDEVERLDAVNDGSRAAIAALATYVAADPPPARCPHPDWPNGRQGD